LKAHFLVVRRIFAFEGYGVTVAASGSEALKRSLENPPDLDIIGYLRNKLEAEGESRLIHTVRGVGYILKE
jgi:DNA-binding response OmpR family regulator